MSHHVFPWQAAFLAALRLIPIVQHACDVVGIERSTAYRARLADKDFAQAWEDAMEAGVDRAEQEAFRRGVVGFEEPVVYQGQLTPLWAHDVDGELIIEDYETGDTYPKGHPKAGEPVIGRRPVQARDAAGQPAWLTINKRSDAMLSLVLKARRASYRTERTELTGADGGPLAIDETTRRARVKALLDAAAKRKVGSERDPEDFA